MRVSSASTTKVFSMYDLCPHCKRELKKVRVSIAGIEKEVTCYGSCGCDESKMDGTNVEPVYRKFVKAGIPQHYIGAECDLNGWDDSVFDGQSIYVHGDLGVGKTHFASVLSKRLIDMGMTVSFENSKHLMTEIQESYSGIRTNAFERAFGCQVLVLDDLGKEQVTPHSISVLYEIIDSRYAAGKQIVVTSNFTRGELLQRWSAADAQTAESIVSRLCDGVQQIHMQGRDRRLG